MIFPGTMIVEFFSVIRCKNNQCIRGLAESFQRVQQMSDVIVQITDFTIIQCNNMFNIIDRAVVPVFSQLDGIPEGPRQGATVAGIKHFMIGGWRRIISVRIKIMYKKKEKILVCFNGVYSWTCFSPNN